ncbi:MAG: BamA/TamA family outer membrane protein [Candidatus Omnitrophota bacterium]
MAGFRRVIFIPLEKIHPVRCLLSNGVKRRSSLTGFIINSFISSIASSCKTSFPALSGESSHASLDYPNKSGNDKFAITAYETACSLAVILVLALSAIPARYGFAEDLQNFNLSDKEQERIISKASVEKRAEATVLRLSGTSYEMGYQRGALLKGEIKDFFSEILKLFKLEEEKRRGSRLPFFSLTRYFRSKALALDRYIPEEYRQELKGLSKGCGLSYEDILLTHTLVDLAPLVDPGISLKLNEMFSERRLTVFYKPESGNAFVAFGCPGIIGVLSGVNDKGVTIEDNSGKAEDFSRGTPILFLLREALQYSDSFYDSIRIISSSERSGRHNVIVTDLRMDEGCAVSFNALDYNVEFKSDEIAASLNFFNKKIGEFNIKISGDKPIDPFKFYEYEKAPFEYKLEVKEKTKEYAHYSLSYPSIVDTDYPQNTVFLDFYEPAGKDKYPAVVFMSHIAGGIPQVEGEFCRDLASKGIAALLVQTAYQRDYKFSRSWLVNELRQKGADEMVSLLRQIVIEARRGIDWLESLPNVEKDKIGVMGISLGGIMVPVVAGLDTRVKSMVIILGGGDIGDIIWNSYTTKLYKGRLIEEGTDSPLELERKMWMLDPLTFAFKAKEKSAIMINANFDIDVPRSNTLKLWRSLEQPELTWIPTAHFTSLFVIGYAKIKAFQHFYADLVDKDKARRIGLDYIPGSPLSSFRFGTESLVSDRVRFDVSGRFARGENNFKFGVIAYDLFDSPYFGGSAVTTRKDEDERYHLEAEGGSLLFGRNLGENAHGYLKYSFESVNVYDVESSAPTEFQHVVGRKGVSEFSLNWERNTFDDTLYPIDGSYRGISVDLASKGFGGDFNFVRTSAEARWHITTPLPRITFVFRLKGGWIGEFGDSAEVPFFERFYVGGDDTIRGYKSRSIGPKDSGNMPLWGTIMAIGNAEVRFPLFKGFNGAVFYDTGSAWDGLSEIRLPHDLKNSIGAGLRFRTKWTVLRLDYGYPLNGDPSKESGKFHFGLGVPF